MSAALGRKGSGSRRIVAMWKAERDEKRPGCPVSDIVLRILKVEIVVDVESIHSDRLMFFGSRFHVRLEEILSQR